MQQRKALESDMYMYLRNSESIVYKLDLTTATFEIRELNLLGISMRSFTLLNFSCLSPLINFPPYLYYFSNM